MITWQRNTEGAFVREGELVSREAIIHFLDPRSETWAPLTEHRFNRKEAIAIIESAIAGKRTNRAGYRLVSAPARQIDEATRARLDRLHERGKETDVMAKNKGKRKPKAERSEGGRKPTLAPFIDGLLEIHATYKEKEFKAKVNADGTILFDGELFTSPSSAGKAAIKKSVDGWTFWKFTKGDKDLPLDTLRGSKSPLESAA